MAFAEEIRQALAAVSERAGPSVVRVGRRGGRGAGVVVADGVVLTNAHNLRGEETTVTFAGGRSAAGSVAGVDVDGDLAAVRVDTSGARPIEWAPGDPVGAGTAVFAVAALADGATRVTFGTVSAAGRSFRGPRGRLITGGIEHTAPLARGSSGSPVVDGDGRLLGINTHRLGEGFYLAQPAGADLRARVEALARGESPGRVRLGVALAPPHAARRLREAVGLPDRDGLLVRAVEDGSPAERAGVARGDLLVEAAGRALATPDDLFAALDGLGDADSVTVRLVRGAEERELTVSLAPPPSG